MDVVFSSKQLQWLLDSFPEKVGNANTSEAELRIQQGIRRVVHAIAQKVDDPNALVNAMDPRKVSG